MLKPTLRRLRGKERKAGEEGSRQQRAGEQDAREQGSYLQTDTAHSGMSEFQC